MEVGSQMFNRSKFIEDRVANREMTEEDIANFDTFMALKSASMNPRLYKICKLLNTIEFTKLDKFVQAKVFEGFNGKNLTDCWFRADSSYIASKDELHKRIMKLLNTDGNTATFIMRNNEVDVDDVNELYDYKFNGIIKSKKKTRKSKK